ncbi:DUF2569 family protein, partial [Escherichia coli]|uniref:DUF2569 family protein n=1 Tax=Escherichia coli TaxID=562 RepID=UPI000AC48B9A
SHPVYLFLREFSLQDFRGGSKHYIIWLLISVLLAVKAFAFSPVEDGIAVRQLLFTLLATALIVPYFKRSSRVKATFVNP